MARAALALPFAGLSGSLGDVVIVQLPDGVQVRRRRPVVGGRTPGQDAARRRIEGPSAMWKNLDEDMFQAWRGYALERATRNPATGAVVTPKAYSLFVGLATKARQVDPGLDLRRFGPPARPFLGDGVGIEILPPGGGQGGGPSDHREGSDPTPAPPQGEGSPSLLFRADRANAPGVVTEILGQPLANRRRAAYADKYVSRAFVAFAGAETVAVPFAAGAWALAYRFVEAATGQATGLVELGVVEVG